MRKSIMGFIAIISMFVSGFTAGAQTKDESAVEKLIHSYFDALNAGIAENVSTLFTETGVLVAPGAPTATGSEQVNGTFNYVFDNFKYSLKVSIEEVIVQGNYAIVSSTSTGSFVIKASNETVPTDYRETFILQKENGIWKIARYMYNQPK